MNKRTGMNASKRRMIAMIVLLTMIPGGCRVGSTIFSVGVENDPVIHVGEGGVCPPSHEYCLDARGFEAYVACLDDARRLGREIEACERYLHTCQRDLDAVPDSVICEAQVIYRVPGWVPWVVAILAVVAAGGAAAAVGLSAR